jgi:hypothetical protein
VGARVDRLTPGRLRVAVWPWGEEEVPWILGLEDLPEAFRNPVEEALREALLARWIPVEERIAARRAGKTLQDLIGAALAAGISALAMRVGAQGDEPPAPPDVELEESLAGIRDLADLHRLLGLSIPFDAQTDFYRILEAVGPEMRTYLSELRDPLGFVLT